MAFQNDPQNDVVDWLRKTYLEKHNIDTSNFSNEQLIHKYGQDLEGAGLTRDGIHERHGSAFTDQYYDIKNRPAPDQGYLDEFGSGLSKSTSGTLGMGSAALGLSSGLVGADGAEKYFMDQAAEFQQDASESTPTIDRASDVRWDRPEEVARFIMGGLGEALPSMASSLIGFGGGGVVGSQIAKQATRRSIRKAIQERGGEGVAETVTEIGRELIKANARKGFGVGSMVGTGVNSFGLSTGEIYSELYEFTKLPDTHVDHVAPDEARRISVGFGMLSGSLDFFGAGKLLSKLTGTPAEGATKYLKRLVLGLPEGVIVEGTTEAMQEFINVAASKYARGMEMEFDDQEIARMFDAGVLGALGGAQFAAVGAIKGPPNPMLDEPDDPNPTDPTAERQKSLLQNLQEQRGEEARYKKGDKVAIGLEEEKGEVIKVSGDTAQVRTSEGTIKKVPMSRLTADIKLPEIKEEDGTSTILEDTDKPSDPNPDIFEDPQKVFEESPPIPKAEAKGDQSLTLDINGETKVLPDLTVQQVKDTKELYDTMLGFAEDGTLTKNSNYANKTGGTPPTAVAMKDKLGEEKFKTLWTNENRQRLRNAGVINNSGDWLLGTKLDKEFDDQTLQKVVDGRLNFLNLAKSWLAPGKIVEYKKAKTKGEVEEITEDGMVILKDEEGNTIKDVTTDEPMEFFPEELRGLKPPRQKKKKKAVKKPPKGDFEKEIVKEEEEVVREPLFTPDGKNFTLSAPVDFSFKGKPIKFIYTTGKDKRSKSSKEYSVKDSDGFTQAVREWVKNSEQNKRGFSKVALDTAHTVQIGDQEYDFNIEFYTDNEGTRSVDYIHAAGLELDGLARESLEEQKGTIPFSIKEMVMDDDILEDDALDQAINHETSVPEGNSLLENADEITRSKVAVVLREDSSSSKYPYESIRVVTLVIGKKAGGVRVLKGFDSETGKAINLKGGTKKNLSNFSIIGKLTGTKAVGKVDIYYDTLEDFLADKKVNQAGELAKVETAKEQKKFQEAKDALSEEDALKVEAEELKKQIADKNWQKKQEGEKVGEAKKRVSTAKARYQEIRKLLKEGEKKQNKATGKGGEQEKKLNALQELMSRVEDERKKIADKAPDAITQNELKSMEEAAQDMAAKLGASTNTGKGGFIEDVNEEDGPSADENNASSNSKHEQEKPTASGKRAGKKQKVAEDLSLATAGRDLTRIQDMKTKELFELVASQQSLLKEIIPLLEAYTQEKREQAGYSQTFIGKLNSFITSFYNTHVGSAIKPNEVNKAQVMDFNVLLAMGANSQGMQTFQKKFVEVLEMGEKAKLHGLAQKHLDFIGQAKELLKTAGYLPYEIIDKAYKHLGVYGDIASSSAETANSIYDLSMGFYSDPKLDAVNLSESELIDIINGERGSDIANRDQIRKVLNDIYGVEIDPGSLDEGATIDGAGIPTEETAPNHDLLVDDLKRFVNPNYQSDVAINEEESEQTLANRFSDPINEGKLNSDTKFIPNKVSSVTGEVENEHVLVTDEATSEVSRQTARESKQSYTAPEENPLENYPDLLEEGRSAMEAFAPEGVGVPFSARTALNQILEGTYNSSIKNVARLLDNGVLRNYTIEFMEWSQFRPYASTTKGVLNKSVILPGKKKIIISTAYNNSYRHSAKDTLAAEIVHEAMHAVTKPVLDLGFAASTGRNLQGAIDEHGKPADFNVKTEDLAKVWKDVTETLLPYLREKAGLEHFYGLSSIDEFFSEAQANPKFQEFLSKTELPASMRKRSLLRTVLDYIVNLFARFSMKATKSDSALQYAREEIRKLIDISNGMSGMYDSIVQANLREVSTLANRFDIEDINNSYDGILKRFSQGAPREGDARTIQEIKAKLEGSSKPGQEKRERQQLESQTLSRYAKENNIQISRTSFEQKLEETQILGGEHEVYFDETEMRFYKSQIESIPGGLPSNLESPSQYVDRLILHNSIFPESAYRVDGIMDGRPVVSQEAIIGEDPSQAQIDDHMEAIGFTKLVGYSKPIYRKGDIDVWDIRAGNAYMVDGNLVVFDPRIVRSTQATRKTESLAKDITENEDKKKLVEKLIKETSDIDELVALMDKLDTPGGILGNEFTDPRNDMPMPTNARPDDNAQIMAMSNAAGFNELVEELIKVHREVGDKLGLDINKFLEIYGRPGGKSTKKIQSLLKKDLEAFEIDPNDVRIEDAGLNSVARSFGVRKAIGNLERVRKFARKNKQSTSYLIADIEDKKLSTKRIYEDLLAGKFPSRNDLVHRFKTRVRAINFQKLEEFALTLPNSGISQADLKSLKDLTDEQLGAIMDSIVETRVIPSGTEGFAELEYGSKQVLLDAVLKSKDPRLNILKGTDKQKRLQRVAIVMAIRDSKDVLSLLRLNKGLIGDQEQGFKDMATKIAIAKDLDALKVKNFPGVMGTPLKYFLRMRQEEQRAVANLEKEIVQLEVYDLIDRSLGDRSARLRMAMGELQPVSIHDGVTLVTLEKDEDGEWKRGSYKVNIKGGKLEDREGFIKVNKNTLIGLRDPKVQSLYLNEPWWDVMREQAELALAEPVLDEHFHAQRAAWFSGLQGLTERFSNLGYEGKKLAQMGTRTVALYRDYAGKSMAYSKQFNASYHKVMGKLKISGPEMYTGLYQDIFWWFDNHPEYAGKEEEAFSSLWKHIKENGNIPDRTLLDEESRRLIKDMVNKAIAARDWEAQVNKTLGNRVRDEEIKVESFINQEMVDFYRLPMEMGFATMPRTLNDSYLRETNRIMEKASWNGPEAMEILKEAGKISTANHEEIYQTLFTNDVVERFVKPYTNTDVRQSVFRGPKDEEGHSMQIGNSFVSEAFKESNGDVFAMANYIFDQLSENQSSSARQDWHNNFLRQWFKRYRQLSKVARRVTNQRHGMQNGESMGNTPQSLDARMVESRLPKEFFYYNMYDEVSTNIRLALMTATASFGRNGEQANRARIDGVNNMEAQETEFNDLMTRAVRGKHEKPRSHYNRAHKREAYRILREEKDITDPEAYWNKLYTDSIAVGEFRVVFDQLGKYYGKDNVSGPYQDANLLLEILGAQSIQVLNNPKSSFWQALSLFEFPNAFRGLNQMAGKATASALGNFVDQTFGGIAEAMGMQLDRTGRAAEMLNDTHFRMDEMDLSFKEYNSMLGSGGDLAQSIKDAPALGIKRYVRMLKNVATHNKRLNKDGKRAPIDPLTLITGIFPYVNNVVNHSIGVGAINAYSDLILQAAKVIEERGLTDYVELSAQDLGMGNKQGEWIIGEEDGYKRANDMLVASGGPSISRLAFDFVDRRKSNKNAFPIEKNIGLLINQVAMNNVAGEGFNSKPSWLYTSPGLRYFSTFLGWPLGKMGRDLQFIVRDPSDKVGTYKALLKYIGLLSAVYAPVGLSFAMLIDWYDEEMLEKPNNLPPISPWAALPILGIPLAMRDEHFSIYSITSRMAKAGVPFGMGMDLVNGLFAKGDPYGSARELSLDSRIFAFSMFKSIYDAVGTWVHSGEYDWQMIGRPIAYGVGGNSVIQMMDLTSSLFDIDSEEKRVADYIGMRNYIKKTSWLMGLELRPPFKGGGKQTALSINTRQMARAAYANDTESFLKNYQEAVESAREQIQKTGRTDTTAEEMVIQSFKDRDLRAGITARKINDKDWIAVLEAIPEDARAKIESALEAHASYLKLIGGAYRQQSRRSQLTMEEARRKSMLMAR